MKPGDEFNGEEAILQAYFDEVASSRPLSRQRERALGARIKLGDMEARDELVRANLRFAIAIAKTFLNSGVPLTDLIGAANLGLLTAAERFDADRGHKFISYAVWWVRQSILQFIHEQNRSIRIPLNKIALLRDIHKTTNRLHSQLGRETDIEELAQEMDLPAQQIEDLLLRAEAVYSIDRPRWEDTDQPLAEFLFDADQEAPDAAVIRTSDRAFLKRILQILDEREQYILNLYLGLDKDAPMNLQEIGQLLGISRERVRQIKKAALNKLKHSSRITALKALAGEV